MESLTMEKKIDLILEKLEKNRRYPIYRRSGTIRRRVRGDKRILGRKEKGETGTGAFERGTE